jgi:hypothetical protein
MHEGKRSYCTAAAAHAAVRSIVRHGHKTKSSYLTEYRCWFCPAWHVGHQRPLTTAVREAAAS